VQKNRTSRILRSEPHSGAGCKSDVTLHYQNFPVSVVVTFPSHIQGK
jgi:hypothetical protein